MQYTKDKLKDVIQRYRLKSCNNKSDKFIYNAIALDLEKTIEEIGINKGNIIVGNEPTIIGWAYNINPKIFHIK